VRVQAASPPHPSAVSAWLAPPGAQVVQFALEAVRAEAFNPGTLFLFGCYTIGKERLFLEVARALQRKARPWRTCPCCLPAQPRHVAEQAEHQPCISGGERGCSHLSQHTVRFGQGTLILLSGNNTRQCPGFGDGAGACSASRASEPRPAGKVDEQRASKGHEQQAAGVSSERRGMSSELQA